MMIGRLYDLRKRTYRAKKWNDGLPKSILSQIEIHELKASKSIGIQINRKF